MGGAGAPSSYVVGGPSWRWVLSSPATLNGVLRERTELMTFRQVGLASRCCVSFGSKEAVVDDGMLVISSELRREH